MRRYAVIDLGTNTFHLLIVEAEGGDGFREIYRERKYINLAEEGIGIIGEGAYERGLDALIYFREKLDEYEVQVATALGTEALRSSSNGHQFGLDAKRLANIDIQLISGFREARLIYEGVKHVVTLQEEPDLIMDIGGGSVEFIIANKSGILWAQSFPVGISVLFKQFHENDPISSKERANIESFLDFELQVLNQQLQKYKTRRLIGAAGSFDVFKEMYEEAAGGVFSIPLEAFEDHFKVMIASTKEEREQMDHLAPQRVSMIVVGFLLIGYVLKKSKLKEIVFSPQALKEGVILRLINGEEKQKEDEFRVYYNHTIYPELLRLEFRRKRLLRLLFLSAILIGALFVLEIYVNIFLLTLLIALPVGAYVLYLIYRIRLFKITFKPRIVGLILDFMDELPNFSNLKYDIDKKIEKSRFKKSSIFTTKAPFYKGEDFISGKIGEMDFELSELDVREHSPINNNLQTVFRGIFLYAIFNEETEGSIILWPRHQRQYLTRAIKAVTWEGAENVDHEILNDAFREKFIVYATEDTHVISILSDPMQAAIIEYIEKYDKDIYISFVNKEIYAGITSEDDILEPHVFRSNLSFKLIDGFYKDIKMALEIVRDFDQTH